MIVICICKRKSKGCVFTDNLMKTKTVRGTWSSEVARKFLRVSQICSYGEKPEIETSQLLIFQSSLKGSAVPRRAAVAACSLQFVAATLCAINRDPPTPTTGHTPTPTHPPTHSCHLIDDFDTPGLSSFVKHRRTCSAKKCTVFRRNMVQSLDDSQNLE